MIKWTKEFETGSEALDQQHRTLIDNINLLKELLNTTNPSRQEAEFANGGCWMVRRATATDAYLSATFSAPQHSPRVFGYNTWRGTLLLPAAKIPITRP